MTHTKDNGKCSPHSHSRGLALLSCSLLFLLAACGSRTTIGSANSPALTATPSLATPLTLKFACNDTPGGGFYVLGNGTRGRVCVQTVPGAALTIIVKFCNGPADPSRELKGTVYADSTGYHEWNWKPQTACAGNIWKGEADVTAQLDGQTKSLSTSFFGD